MTKVIEKLDIEKSDSKLTELLLDQDTNNILIRGFFDEDKVALTFFTIGKLSEYNNGTVVIGNTTVTNEREFLEKGLCEPIPHINLQDTFRIGDLSVRFTKWNKHKNSPFNWNDDFAIFHPVQSVLYSDKNCNDFKKVLSNSKAKKNILLTTNDFCTHLEKLYDEVDAVLILDTTMLDDKHKEEFNNIKRNLIDQGKELPY
ncbi:hypothetical protein [Ligilactobacillus salivarius]|uniref:Uncharacterized protein n=1 Tax=Ligilactobacillus salivarius TaxID=1624 RepID=A0A9X6S4F3_9LACO|nr:hypothetical protein [Ligilactobacillus salivarius]PAY26928.1 hypothetical protein A8C33_07525 [Ligilactobacillus salivarius]PAY29188.1 hypothetical protein A8C49_07025 [Ligilactobacillus salivarius]PAY30412.1 hypothetical protein A8C44_08245 [Ligilactobacillus salivarius]PAY35505.1 hypothetical protein A8C50_07200 [Ligilactobacillus salivarius]PAY40543.1 hypothetical protein A8C51_07565 [Ligilactobacillus salivarius]